jgi:hypothetical protein
MWLWTNDLEHFRRISALGPTGDVRDDRLILLVKNIIDLVAQSISFCHPSDQSPRRNMFQVLDDDTI